MVLIAGKVDNLAIYIISQIMSKGCCHPCRQKDHTYCCQHNKQCHQHHPYSSILNIPHLNSIQIFTHGLIFCFYATYRSLSKNGFRHIGKLLIYCLQHLLPCFIRHIAKSLHRICSLRHLHFGKHHLAFFASGSKRSIHHQGFAQKIV